MVEPIKLDILAIAAHPDDTEITCGGLLIKMAKMGRRIGALDLTRGEMGTLGDTSDRDAEAAAAPHTCRWPCAALVTVSYFNLAMRELPDTAVFVENLVLQGL